MCRIFLKNKKGFTLVELMVVVLILGLLTAIGIPSYRGAKIYAERRIVETNLRMIDDAIDMYYMMGNTEELANDGNNKGEFLDVLVANNFLHAKIEGPGTARYRLSDWHQRRRAQVFSTDEVGGWVLGLKSFYILDNLPW